jgi:hypothetical protein
MMGTKTWIIVRISVEKYIIAMTTKMTRSALMIITAVLIMILPGFEKDGNKSFFEVLKEKLDRFNHDFYNEKVYVITDRFVYRQGEDVWFQGFVSSLISPHGDSSSEDLFIKLLNSKGEEIVSRRYPLKENQASGRFLIPRTSIPGKYYLMAYTGWMKNQDPREAFRKEILIGKYFDKRFQVDIFCDKIFYYTGDSLNATLRLLDPAGKPLSESDFNYSFGSFTKSMLRGSGKTDGRGLFILKCQIPPVDDMLVLTIELKSRRISGEYSLIIPFASSEPEVTFHSEDGNVVQGLVNVMAFRCKNKHDMPVSIDGEIIDYKGHVIQAVHANNRGLGSFNYVPPADTCFLRISKPAGISKLIPLPLASRIGLVLHLQKLDADTARFTLRSSGENPDTVLYAVAIMNRQLVWSKAIPFNGNGAVKIPVTGLQTGIMQITVFNVNYQTIAERLLYIPGNEVIRTKTDQQIYHSRQRVMIAVDYLGISSKINLTLSVSLRQLAYNPLNIGFEQVISGFPYDTLAKWPGISMNPSEFELLTADYRQICWSDLMDAKGSLPLYKKHDGLTGLVMDRKENAAQHAKVRVTHIPNLRLFETQTSEKGYFQVLFGSDVIDFNYLNIDAYDAPGKVNLIASVNRDYPKKLQEYIIQKEENRDREKLSNTLSYGDPDVIYSLRYGPRKYKKSEIENRKRYDPKLYADYASVMDIIQEIKPCRIKNNMIVFSDTLQTVLPANIQEGVIIVINGVLKGTNLGILKNLLPSDITNINISESLTDVYRYTTVNFQGVIELTTIQGMYRYRQPTVQLGMDILNTSREFYSPDYAIESLTNSDNRKTLFWKPQFTVTRGQTAMIAFYTSDIKGIYYGKIEGMDAEGHPIHSEFTFVVE